MVVSMVIYAYFWLSLYVWLYDKVHWCMRLDVGA